MLLLASPHLIAYVKEHAQPLSSIGCVTKLLSLPFFLPGPAGANYKFGYFVPCLHLLHLIFAQIYSSLHDLIGHTKIFCSTLLHDH